MVGVRTIVAGDRTLVLRDRTLVVRDGIIEIAKTASRISLPSALG
jgi:hypothetical protein